MTLMYSSLIGKPEGEKTPVRPGRICEDNIKTNLKEIGVRIILKRILTKWG
jgi:hypothetical protein